MVILLLFFIMNLLSLFILMSAAYSSGNISRNEEQDDANLALELAINKLRVI